MTVERCVIRCTRTYISKRLTRIDLLVTGKAKVITKVRVKTKTHNNKTFLQTNTKVKEIYLKIQHFDLVMKSEM